MATDPSSQAPSHRPRGHGGARKVGRPRIIEGPVEMDRLVGEYVNQCAELGDPVTLTGMILHLGLTGRQSLDRYGARPEFRDSVKRAKLVVEHAYEMDLRKARPAGAIFALKNLGWSDHSEVVFRGSLASIQLDRLPDALLERIARGEHPLAVLASWAEEGHDIKALLGRGGEVGNGPDGV